MNSYLEFLDNPTLDNIKLAHKTSGLTHQQVATIIGIGLQTYRGWLAPVESINHRKPANAMWNLLLYELESRRLGYDNLNKFFLVHVEKL